MQYGLNPETRRTKVLHHMEISEMAKYKVFQKSGNSIMEIKIQKLANNLYLVSEVTVNGPHDCQHWSTRGFMLKSTLVSIFWSIVPIASVMSRLRSATEVGF